MDFKIYSSSFLMCYMAVSNFQKNRSIVIFKFYYDNIQQITIYSLKPSFEFRNLTSFTQSVQIEVIQSSIPGCLNINVRLRDRGRPHRSCKRNICLQQNKAITKEVEVGGRGGDPVGENEYATNDIHQDFEKEDRGRQSVEGVSYHGDVEVGKALGENAYLVGDESEIDYCTSQGGGGDVMRIGDKFLGGQQQCNQMCRRTDFSRCKLLWLIAQIFPQTLISKETTVQMQISVLCTSLVKQVVLNPRSALEVLLIEKLKKDTILYLSELVF